MTTTPTTTTTKSRCSHCIFNKTDDADTCNSCIRNPLMTDKFKSTDAFYPLEINGTHINLWAEDGTTKWTVALFEYSQNEELWDLRYIGIRPLDKRVDWIKLKELIIIGYRALEGTTL